MPRDGSGVFSLVAGYLAVTGEAIESSQHNPPLEDIASDLNAPRPIASGGTGATNAGAARTNLGVKTEAELQAAFDARYAPMAAGTSVVFYQSSAPVGWTRITNPVINDRALRIVTGALSSGGLQSLTSLQIVGSVGNTTLTLEQIPPHNHRMTRHLLPYGESGGAGHARNWAGGTPVFTEVSGGGQPHGHSLTLNETSLRYLDCIIATRDAP